ncbi:MAG TPA: amino acid permease [Chitinophagales bacterium]|nr:amino acid permease [Chitinophagales bacterium]
MDKLIRGLNLWQAVAVNTIDMVGIGPFVTLSFIMGAMSGPLCLLAWLMGALLAFADGAVWAELGAKWPEAGGSYVFLQKLYGENKGGRLMAFLFTWQTIIQAPLVIASGAIGFSMYLTYLLPLSTLGQKAVSGVLVMLVTAMLYRKITDIGKISLAFGSVVVVTIIWIIAGGFTHFNSAMAFALPQSGVHFDGAFFKSLGSAGTKAIYCYLGYYNVCHLGAEIKSPERNIPRSIFLSVAIIAVLYLLMQTAVLGVVPWLEAKDSSFIISLFIEKTYGPYAAQVATALILLIAVSSLFAVMLGYSRVPYAAAANGNFFRVFSKLHPTKHFPHVSLLVLGAVAFVFSLLFKMKEVITAIIVMRILVQFVAQALGIMAWHQKHKTETMPYRMWLFPLPPLAAIGIWLFIFFSADWVYIAAALGIIATGGLLYFIKERFSRAI